MRSLQVHETIVLLWTALHQLIGCLTAIIDVSKDPTGAELGKQDAFLTILHGDVRVSDRRQGKEYEGASRKLND